MPIPLDQDLQNPDQFFGGEFPAAAGKELCVCLFEKLIDGESFQWSGCKTLPLFHGVENQTGDPVAGGGPPPVSESTDAPVRLRVLRPLQPGRYADIRHIRKGP